MAPAAPAASSDCSPVLPNHAARSHAEKLVKLKGVKNDTDGSLEPLDLGKNEEDHQADADLWQQQPERYSGAHLSDSKPWTEGSLDKHQMHNDRLEIRTPQYVEEQEGGGNSVMDAGMNRVSLSPLEAKRPQGPAIGQRTHQDNQPTLDRFNAKSKVCMPPSGALPQIPKGSQRGVEVVDNPHSTPPAGSEVPPICKSGANAISASKGFEAAHEVGAASHIDGGQHGSGNMEGGKKGLVRRALDWMAGKVSSLIESEAVVA